MNLMQTYLIQIITISPITKEDLRVFRVPKLVLFFVLKIAFNSIEKNCKCGYRTRKTKTATSHLGLFSSHLIFVCVLKSIP